jgi:hypothetical protein
VAASLKAEGERAVFACSAAIDGEEMQMRRLVLLLALVLAAAAAVSPASANAPAQHFTEDVTGDEIVCGSTVYTVTSGLLVITIHEGESASGNMNFTGTVVPRDVVLEDADGNVFSIQGAEWFGGTFNAQQGTFQFTDTDYFTIVSSGGGVVGTVRATFHISPNGKVVDLNFGTCELPEEE